MTENATPVDAGFAREELLHLAEIAAAILDGDEVARIIEPKSMHYIAHPDTEYRFLTADYYDVDHERFLRTKKLLLRLERLARVAVDSAIWVPVGRASLPATEGGPTVTLAVQNGANHRYYQFGTEKMATPAEMKEVLQGGRIVAVPRGPGEVLVTVLAPIRDSLGDVVAVAELTASLDPQGPAWS